MLCSVQSSYTQIDVGHISFIIKCCSWILWLYALDIQLKLCEVLDEILEKAIRILKGRKKRE